MSYALHVRGLRIFVALGTIAVCASATATAFAQVDQSTLVNPQHKRTLQVDRSVWFGDAPPSSEAVARMQTFIAQARAAKTAKSAIERKLNPLLRTYVSHTQSAAVARTDPNALRTALRARFPLLGIQSDGAVRVNIDLADASAQTLVRLRKIVRLVAVNLDTNRATAAVLPANVDALIATDVVTHVSPIVGGIVHTGSIESEGDAALKATDARAHFGVSGKNVRVGVMSDGISSIDTPVATGDIPNDGHGHAAVDLCPLNDNSGDEGTAMLEIVHDLAPAARLAFCPGFGDSGEQGMADAITWLATKSFGGKGADIIIDDVAFLTEPYFQDGLVAQAVDTVSSSKGVAYFSSAGNSADNHYELPYFDVHPGLDPGSVFEGSFLNAHDFGQAAGGASNIAWNGRVAGAGNFFAVFLQWNDAFAHAGDDYDVYLFDTNGRAAGDPLGVFPDGGNGIDTQDGTGDPLEVAFIVNPDGAPPVGTIKNFFIVVDRFSGSPNKLLEMNFNGFFALNPVFNVPAGSVWGHAAARGAFAIAATGAVENIDGSVNPGLDVIEDYSSRGPSLIFFDKKGHAQREVRKKPDFTAVDGVSVTGVDFETPFFGTSAAAPHAGAVAALLEDVDPFLGPSGVQRILKETALERGDPGFDLTWGNGLLDALAATRRAGQVGNSNLYFMCTPGFSIPIVVPEQAIHLLLPFGFEFGKCDHIGF
jgi:hypothetical protein